MNSTFLLLNQDLTRITYLPTPLLLLDLDGAVRHSKSGKKFVSGVEDVAVYSDVAGVVQNYKEQGFVIAAVSNQDGVAYGIQDPMQVVAEFHQTNALLGNIFDVAIFSFAHEKGKRVPYNTRSLLRKPDYGMLAVLEWELNRLNILPLWDMSHMIGDRDEGETMAMVARIPFFWAKDAFGRNE